MSLLAACAQTMQKFGRRPHHYRGRKEGWGVPKKISERLMVTFSKKRQKGLVSGPSHADQELIELAFRKQWLPSVDNSFLAELEKRGYDLTTLRFSIDKKKNTA
jgi:hypothetical protein